MKKFLMLILILLSAIGCSSKENIPTVEYNNSDAMGLNPILPLYEYIPDGEPHIFDNKVYLYGSHDKAGGDKFCMNDYVVYSAPIDNLELWTFEGISYEKTQDPRYEDGKGNYLYAPDVVCGKDGKYYLYYCLDPHPEIGVAVADSPEGPFEYYGLVKHQDGSILGQKESDFIQFDPGVFIDEDGSIYLYSGNAPRFKSDNVSSNQGSQVMILEDDMITLKTDVKKLLPDVNNSEGSGFEGHEFFEASSLRKIGNTYYLVYSSVNLHELCYAYSKYPDKDFKYGGVLISNIDVFDDDDIAMNKVGNNHGSLEQINGQWYIFYHRHTHGNSYSRQACAERIYINKNGTIPQVEITTTGLSAVSGKTTDWISAGRACNLIGNYNADKNEEEQDPPYVKQSGRDREDTPHLYVTKIQSNSVVGFKYFNCDKSKSVTISVRGDFTGKIEILDNLNETPKGSSDISTNADWTEYTIEINDMKGDSAIYFYFEGNGILDFEKFKINY